MNKEEKVNDLASFFYLSVSVIRSLSCTYVCMGTSLDFKILAGNDLTYFLYCNFDEKIRPALETLQISNRY